MYEQQSFFNNLCALSPNNNNETFKMQTSGSRTQYTEVEHKIIFC